MLITGYLGEINKIERLTANILGFVFLEGYMLLYIKDIYLLNIIYKIQDYITHSYYYGRFMVYSI